MGWAAIFVQLLDLIADSPSGSARRLQELLRMQALAKAGIVSRGLLVVSVVFAVGLASCESAAPPPPPPAPVAELPPPPPPVLLPAGVIESASVYRAYVDRASAIDAGFTGGESVASSLKIGETYQIDQFQRGETAYAAIVALQDPVFVASLRVFAADAGQRRKVTDAILIDPNYAASFKGADSAAGLVIAALTEQGKRLQTTGAKVKQAAYDVQHQAWSKADVADRPQRLALAKSISAERQKAVEDDAGSLRQAATGATPMTVSGDPVAGPYTPLVARALAVAAMAALGEGGEEYADQINGLLAENNESYCLNMAKLNLYQCLAVSKPHYEDVFCLGQHILADTGQCIMRGARKAVFVPAPVAATPPAPPLPTVQAKPAARRGKATRAAQ
jgi:hypothetical protein